MKSVYFPFVLLCAVVYEKHRLSIENELRGDDIYSFHLLQGAPLACCSFSFSFPPTNADPHCHPFRVFFQRKYYHRSGQDTLCTSVPQIDDELAESLHVLPPRA